MKTVAAALAVLLCTLSAPAAAQTATARMEASATVVMPVTVSPSAVSVSGTGGTVDVTRPMAVAGSVAWVLEVVEGAATDPSARRRPAFTRGRAGEPVTTRLGDRPAAAGPRPVNYVVATIN